ncbi:MAG: UDP-N-acetylglucosamine--N-acetylmuramyl-(pentapeptide) pyrophosphoryl-undecaprenol N-acetylglucosamine transferase [Helicobacter sp.]|nr:UDP-N-acetylglucosamine--N-acetylmuramyl-(pentapeptide) pyrophosphoryl-undecaprenol N-acetylglucosamine transferase [Helicobacter sp.]MDD7567351.1 UDP-N-acetylglucosamine--N-acetylmuramyl-(pentapeptide) pyrophosphoryl-undecaprenol N-acetylglucosamine transferase [Helicobacter sp.]MDY5741328.1 UDP-N-acetylglucosamine--N-acetylmuramyl-(pentapeptide) pyrophosphoryl-undecaprenol N-acetylglucosamine transferase [Helicobacter sp.]
MFVITGGGTGGHLAIAKVLATTLHTKNIPCIYIGSNIGQDRLWFANSEIFENVYFLDSTGVVNKKGFAKIKALYKAYKACIDARKICRQHNANAVISVGGFSAAGASIAALTLKIPLFIHEQNASFGTLNKILRPFAKNVFGAFPHKSKNFVQCAYPIRAEFFAYARIRKEIKTILFLGGSQGAKTINNLALALAPKFLESGLKVIHQCGKADAKRVEIAYKEAGILEKIEFFDFSHNLIEKLIQSDVCISRAGASSVWESCANGLPCFFVPYPYAHKDHQYFNALWFKERNLAGLCRESQNIGELEASILEFLGFLDSSADGIKNIEHISKKLCESISSDGSDEIVRLIESGL